MNNYISLKGFLSVLFLLCTFSVISQEQTNPTTEYQHTGKLYPPVFFVTNINEFTFDEKLKEFKAFADVSTEAIGLPIGVRVLKGHRTKKDGTQFSSLMLSASTLGIIPVVQNTEFKVHYEVWVQGNLVNTFKYQLDTTDVNSMWTMNYARDTTPTEEQFIIDTLPLFFNELKGHEEIQEVFSEYWLYFE